MPLYSHVLSYRPGREAAIVYKVRAILAGSGYTQSHWDRTYKTPTTFSEATSLRTAYKVWLLPFLHWLLL